VPTKTCNERMAAMTTNAVTVRCERYRALYAALLAQRG
jgi:hypothetical protein